MLHDILGVFLIVLIGEGLLWTKLFYGSKICMLKSNSQGGGPLEGA